MDRFPPAAVKAARAGILLLAGLAAGCMRLDLSRADRLARVGRHEAALQAYLRAAERRPEHTLAPAALFRAGTLATRVLGDDALARELFQRLIDRYGDRGGWGRRAERAIFDAPNYFPLPADGRWEEGDSETGGRALQVATTCRPWEKDPSAALTVSLRSEGGRPAAGPAVVRVFRKENLELRESAPGSKAYAVLLKYPLEPGQSWTTGRADGTWIYTVLGSSDVHVRAGVFPGCLMVREERSGGGTFRRTRFYAPGVGRVLTLLGGPEGEKRETELLSYDLGTGPEIGAL